MRNDYCVADLKQDILFNVWTSSPILKKLRTLNVDTLNECCSKCSVRYYCGAFCRGETLSSTGKLNSPYVRCGAWKKALMRVFDFVSETPDLYAFPEFNSGKS